ncbi:MAG: DNA-binding response regulator [Sphingobacteriales bacterium UTBCD1]|jgi:two-component system LytT family response regulator|nr:MAG: DNA-binding response regulator [Sphingobacteriales bacterium UTBCD1]
MIKAILIDDEANNISNLSGLLQKYCKEVFVVGTALNADDGINLINDLRPDLVFLDIQMPGKNGLEMLKSLSSYNFEIIFVTAYGEYAIQAIKFAAIDYLLKPINTEELIMAVKRAADKSTQKRQNIQLENLIELLQKNQTRSEHKIALSGLKETRFVRTIDVIRCESSNSYTIFFLVNAEKITVSKSISEFEKILNEYDFIRCHQCHLVNKKFVTRWIKTDGDYLLLEDKTMIPISRQKKVYIKEQLNKKY